MARSNRWLVLALLVCAYGCATRGVVRLEAEGRAPLVYTPPSDARMVAVGGDNGARVLVMVALAAAGGRAGMSVRGPTLPGYAAAAVAAEANAGLRLATVAQGAVRSVTFRPGALILGVAPTAVASMAWGSGGGGATAKPQGRLTGRPSRVKPDDEAEKVRAIARENESARTLAEHGYDVEQNPLPRVGHRTKPDYSINGEYYDCYSPSTDNPRSIASAIEKKVQGGQAEKIVLNLDDSTVSTDLLRKQLADWPIPGLKAVIAIRNGLLVNLLP